MVLAVCRRAVFRDVKCQFALLSAHTARQGRCSVRGKKLTRIEFSDSLLDFTMRWVYANLHVQDGGWRDGFAFLKHKGHKVHEGKIRKLGCLSSPWCTWRPSCLGFFPLRLTMAEKWARLDSNQRPSDYESPALTTAPRARESVERERLQVECCLLLPQLSTCNLQPNLSGRRDSNPRISAWKADALPLGDSRAAIILP